MKYSIVVPFHNEEETLPILHRRLATVMEAAPAEFELVFVDDGSVDRTPALLQEICARDPRVVGVRLRRNFGQTAALAAGFDHATGEVIVAMDGDLQHRPEDIPRFLAKIDEGYDVVSGWRQGRQDGFRRTFPSKIANRLMARASGVPIHDFGTTFKAYRRDVLRRIPLYGQMHRFIPAMASIEGARIAEVPIEDQPRVAGQSHYGLSRTFRVMFDILTIRLLVRYLSRPLHFFGSIGAVMILIAFALAGWLLFKKVVWREDIFIQNGPMLLFSAVAFLGGIQFLGLGLLGDLFARLYYAPEQRNIYSVASVYRAEK
ncbi:MAG: glycosyltransferase family 2 protein [Blastocatellia bacterium]|nr:glycosyltransferase family 2 protein [Blastocatellia bacterium]